MRNPLLKNQQVHMLSNGIENTVLMMKSRDKWGKAGFDFWGLKVDPTGSWGEETSYKDFGKKAFIWLKRTEYEGRGLLVSDAASAVEVVNAAEDEHMSVRCIRDSFLSIDESPAEKLIVTRPEIGSYALTLSAD